MTHPHAEGLARALWQAWSDQLPDRPPGPGLAWERASPSARQELIAAVAALLADRSIICGEQAAAVLDEAIRDRRRRRDGAFTTSAYQIQSYYVDALQEARRDLLGGPLPEEENRHLRHPAHVLTGQAFIEAMMEAGVIGRGSHVRRVVIDAQAGQVLVIHAEHHGDQRLLEVVPIAAGVQVSSATATRQAGPAAGEVPDEPWP